MSSYTTPGSLAVTLKRVPGRAVIAATCSHAARGAAPPGGQPVIVAVERRPAAGGGFERQRLAVLPSRHRHLLDAQRFSAPREAIEERQGQRRRRRIRTVAAAEVACVPVAQQ